MTPTRIVTRIVTVTWIVTRMCGRDGPRLTPCLTSSPVPHQALPREASPVAQPSESRTRAEAVQIRSGSDGRWCLAPGRGGPG